MHFLSCHSFSQIGIEPICTTKQFSQSILILCMLCKVRTTIVYLVVLVLAMSFFCVFSIMAARSRSYLYTNEVKPLQCVIVTSNSLSYKYHPSSVLCNVQRNKSNKVYEYDDTINLRKP